MTEIFFQNCICGRSFSRVSDFTKHECGCTKGKKRLSGALAKAKEVYQRKKLRMDLGEAQRDRVMDDDVLPHPVRARLFVSNHVIQFLTEVT